MLHWPTRIPRFFIFARGDSRGDGPEGDEDREEGQEGEEEPCEAAAADFEGQVTGNGGAEDDEEDVGEGFAAGGVGGEGPILDRGVLEQDVTACLHELAQLKVSGPFNGFFDLRW